MTDYWITTHWPTPVTVPGLSRHVYVKGRHVTVPKPGDLVFIREAIEAEDKDGRRVRTVDIHHRGEVTAGLRVPRGSGGIIGMATVDGVRRRQLPDDIVFDFGDLGDWRVIPCRDFQPARLSLRELRAVLRKDNVRGMNLWHIPEEAVGVKVLRALRR